MILTEYDADNLCTSCGEHIADPHAPQCPRNWHPSDAYDWNRPDYDPISDPYFEVSDR